MPRAGRDELRLPLDRAHLLELLDPKLLALTRSAAAAATAFGFVQGGARQPPLQT